MKEIKEKITDPKLLNRYLKIVNKSLNNSVRLRKLNSKNYEVKKRTKLNTEYNCYGFVAYMNRWFHFLNWLEDYDINYYVDNKTTEVRNYNEIIEGKTIVRFSTKRNYEIQHLAILVKFDKSDILNSRVLHKPGAYVLESTTLRKCLAPARYPNTDIEFRNPIT